MRILCLITPFLCIGFYFITQNEAYAQYRGFYFVNEKLKKVEIPFELHSNLIIVPVTVNDGPPLKFILDTGVRTAILTNEIYVDSIPTPNDREINLLGVGAKGQISAYVTNNVSFDLSGIRAEGNAMLVLKEDYLQLDSYLGVRVHGIIGYEIFSRFTIEIDYERLILTVYRPDAFKPKKSFEVIPMDVEDTKPYIEACLNMDDSTEIAIRLMIDTGASQPLLLTADSGKNIYVPEKHVNGYLGRGLSGEIYGAMARVPSLELNEFVLKDMITSFPEDSAMSKNFITRSQNGNLGGEALKRFTIIFDYANEKVYLRKSNSYKKRFSYNMSGISLTAIGPQLDIYIISNIVIPSPASKVGLKQGDVIINVNGIRSVDLTLSDFSELVHKRPGKQIRMKVYRDGQILKKKFKLQKIL